MTRALPCTAMSKPEDLLRLGKKYSPRDRRQVDVAALYAAQSIQRALMGGLIALLILNLLWVAESLIFDHIFKPFSVLQGFFIGRAIRHFGRGIDWRFAALSAGIAAFAAFTGSFLSALFLTGREFDTFALTLVGEISWHTISTFAENNFGAVGTVYAGMAAVLAAFFSRRKLDRDERIALRKQREGIAA